MNERIDGQRSSGGMRAYPGQGRLRCAVLLGETSDLRFVAKPAGIPCFPPHGDPSGDCVLRRLLQSFPEQDQIFPLGFAGGIAHRLDTLTSGFVVVARSPDALDRVRAEWPSLRKLYRFRSEAAPAFEERVLTEPIANHARRSDRVVVQRWARERHRGPWLPAWTRIKTLGEGWWEAEIRTGVRHQIRAHAAFAGLPLDGDPIYGGCVGTPCLVHVAISGKDWGFALQGPMLLGPA